MNKTAIYINSMDPILTSDIQNCITIHQTEGYNDVFILPLYSDIVSSTHQFEMAMLAAAPYHFICCLPFENGTGFQKQLLRFLNEHPGYTCITTKEQIADLIRQSFPASEIRLYHAAYGNEISPVASEYSRVIGYKQNCSPTNGPLYYEYIKSRLKLPRLAHSIAVSDMARKLAICHGVEVETAVTAALLHDSAKYLPLDEMQNLTKNTEAANDPLMFDNPNLLHGPAAAEMLKRDHLISYPDIYNAIYWHTTGSIDMDKLGMIVYLADKIELTRKPYALLEKIRDLAFRDLRQAVILSISSSIEYVKSRGEMPHPYSEKVLARLTTNTNNTDS